MFNKVENHVIAIDGPVAAGKTAVGHAISGRLGYRFLDTGSMYRAVTWAALQKGINLSDDKALTDAAGSITLNICFIRGGARISVGDTDITEYLRAEDIELNVSRVASVQGVRKILVRKQRAVALEGNIVMVGRDIGSVVLPNAKLKIFLKASRDERARRRYRELIRKGESVTYGNILDQLTKRDGVDSNREHSPLKIPYDSEVIETEGLDIESVVDKIIKLIGES